MNKRIWIIGPVAWDIALYLDTFPTPGSFFRATKKIERVGGSAFNIASSLATTGIQVGFIGYVGDDWQGEKILEVISESEIAFPCIKKVKGESNSPLIIITLDGERTVIAQNASHLDELSLDLGDIKNGDMVVIPLWRTFFKSLIERAKELGCTTVVGLDACLDENIDGADIAIGSNTEWSGKLELTRFPQVIVTHGADGSRYYSTNLNHHQHALEAKVVDATGAGDAYCAGYLAATAHGFPPETAMKYGSAWASVALEVCESIPPHWSKVTERYPDVCF